MDIYQIAALVVAALVGEITVSLAARKLLAKRNDTELWASLTAAVNRARADVLAANQLIEEMEAVNLELRKENQQLNADNLRLEKLTAQLRSQLNTALDDLDFWQNEAKKAFPNMFPKIGGKKSQ